MSDSHDNDGDVVTMSKRGQWVNRVIGREDLSESFASKDEAVDAGRALAEHLGAAHTVRESEPTGVVTDEDPASVEAEPALPDVETASSDADTER